MSRRDRKRPGGDIPNPALAPTTERLRVGDAPVAAAEPEPRPAPRKRVPFGSYLAPDLQRAYKARCVLLGIEMQDALEDAITDWLEKNRA